MVIFVQYYNRNSPSTRSNFYERSPGHLNLSSTNAYTFTETIKFTSRELNALNTVTRTHCIKGYPNLQFTGWQLTNSHRQFK